MMTYFTGAGRSSRSLADQPRRVHDVLGPGDRRIDVVGPRVGIQIEYGNLGALTIEGIGPGILAAGVVKANARREASCHGRIELSDLAMS